MAFTTISLDGYGLFAACDGIIDSAGGTWEESGLGNVTYEVTDPLTGAGSIGHEYASKSGFGYLASTATLDFTAGTGSESGQLIHIWIKIASSSAFDTLANNGFSFVVGTDTSNYRTYKLVGSDDNNGWNSGWRQFVFDPTIAGSIADVGTYNLATISMMGLWVDTIVSVRAPTIFIDQITVINGVRVTGTGTMSELAAYCTDYANRALGSYQEREGLFYSYSKTIVGDNTTATVNTALTDNGVIIKFGKSEFWNGTAWVLTHPSNYNAIVLEKHASYTTDYTSLNTSLLGTIGAELALTAETGATRNLSGGQLRDMLSFNTASGDSTANKVLTNITASSIANTPTGCTWNISGLITIETGGGLSGGIINDATGAVAVVTASISGIVSSAFNSAGTGHAIELTATGTYDWDGNTHSGYGADGTTDAVVYNNSGGTITINVNSGDTPTYLNGSGATTVIVAGAVPVKVTAQTDAGAPIETARVHLVVSSGVGPFPYLGSVSIANSTTTATVTHTTHGMASGDKVLIIGASLDANNGVFTITVTGADTYTYTMASSPGSSPTGTITSTFVALSGTTDANGEISVSRVYPTGQPVTGWTRKSSSSPFYKQGVINATISSTAGMDYTAVMVSDE